MIGDDDSWGCSSYQEDEDGFEIVDPEEARPDDSGFIPPEELEGIA